MDTTVHFQYRSYHIFDNTEEELLAMDNIFALIVLACQKALLEGKVPEQALGEDRSTIARTLLSHGKYDNDRIISFLVFLKNFIFIANQKINRNFDKFIHKLTGGSIDMGIIETVKQQERLEGRLEGKLEGRLEGRLEEKKELVKNLIVQTDFDDSKIASLAATSTDIVQKVRAGLGKNRK